MLGSGGKIVKPQKLLFQRILVVDDFGPWRHFVSTTLGNHPELQVVGEASDGLEAVQKAEELQPDLILLDIGLPLLNGIEAARRIREVSSASKILFVSEDRSLDIAEGALSTGAGGYLVKSNAARELLPAIKAVLNGTRFISASLAGHEYLTRYAVGSEGEQKIENNPYLRFAKSQLLSEFLVSIIEVTGADFGNVQLFDSSNRVLRLAAQHGFEREFLDYFDAVGLKHGCACSKAMKDGSRILVADVATDELFSSESRDVLLRANVGSVHSTPLIDVQGEFVGMVSVQYSQPGGAKPELSARVDELAAGFLTRLNTWSETEKSSYPNSHRQ
jgi:DNA-binding NarL/FixJ family response regulator